MLYRSATQMAAIVRAAGIPEGHKDADTLHKLKDSIFGVTAEDTDDEDESEESDETERSESGGEEALGVAACPHSWRGHAVLFGNARGLWLQLPAHSIPRDGDLKKVRRLGPIWSEASCPGTGRLVMLCHALASTADSFLNPILGQPLQEVGLSVP